MTGLPPAAEFWFVAARVGLIILAGAALIIGLKGVRRARDKNGAPRRRSDASLWPRYRVWLAICAVMVPALYLGGWVLAGVLAAVGAQAAREVWRAARAPLAAARAAAGVRVAALAVIAAWTGAPLALIWLLRAHGPGFPFVAWLFVVVALADIAAMFGGLAFGRTPILPRPSPSKTVEGTLAGLCGALAGAALLRDAFPATAAPVFYGTAAVVFAAGMAGDLAASAVKRWAGIKDFGTALPGHGGVMDRLDSLLMAAPVGYLLSAIM